MVGSGRIYYIKMSERPNWASLALYTGVAIGLGVGIYFLSKDYDVTLDF